MKSKAHLAAAKRHGVLNDPMEQLESIVAASSQRPEAEESETHRERVERFRQVWEHLQDFHGSSVILYPKIVTRPR